MAHCVFKYDIFYRQKHGRKTLLHELIELFELALYDRSESYSYERKALKFFFL